MTVKKPAAKKAAAVKKAPENAIALHLSNGDEHIVGLKALRVLLSKDGNSWFAQGLDIDYAAAGASIESVQENFEAGLCLTVHEHLKMYGHISKFLVVAPQEAWQEYYDAKPECIKQRFSTIQLHQAGCEEVTQGKVNHFDFPFNKVQFIEPFHEAIAA